MSPASSNPEPIHLAAAQTLGLIPADAGVRLYPLPKNPGRLSTTSHSTYVVTGPSSTGPLLFVGTDLNDLVGRVRLFSTAYPGLGATLRGEGRHGDNHYVSLDYLAGQTAAEVLHDPAAGEARVIAALESLAKTYQAATRPSTVDAARAELDEMTLQVLALPYWTDLDRAFLESTAIPYLRENLIPLQPTRRVSNGDLTLHNLLIDDGACRIIDYEHSVDTHFHREDWLRLTYWDVVPDALRTLARNLAGHGPPLQVYLAFKQLLLEARANLPQKAADDMRYWAGVIRRALSQDGSTLHASQFWTATETQAEAGGEIQSQLYWMTDEGWSSERCITANVRPGPPQTVRFVIAAGDTIHALRFDPCDCPGAVMINSFVVRQLDPEPMVLHSAYSAEELAFVSAMGDALLVPVLTSQLQAISIGNDPQLHFNQCGGPKESRLEVEISFTISTGSSDQVALLRQYVKAGPASTPANTPPAGGGIVPLITRLHDSLTGENGLEARLAAEFARQRKVEQSEHAVTVRLTVTNAMLNERTEELRQLREHISGHARTIDRLELALADLQAELQTQIRQREEAQAHQRSAEDHLGRLSQELSAARERAQVLEVLLATARPTRTD